MRVIITGRHMAVSAALRRYIESRMKRLEPYARNMGDVQVTVGVEKYRHTAEVVVRLNGRVIQGKMSTTEMYASVDQLVDKILRQVRKRKEQMVNHKVRHRKMTHLATAKPTEPRSEPLQTIRPTLQTLTLDEAIRRIESEAEDLMVFVNGESGRVQIIRRLANGLSQLIDPQPI